MGPGEGVQETLSEDRNRQAKSGEWHFTLVLMLAEMQDILWVHYNVKRKICKSSS